MTAETKVQSLVRELRSHMPCDQRKEENVPRETILYDVIVADIFVTHSSKPTECIGVNPNVNYGLGVACPTQVPGVCDGRGTQEFALPSAVNLKLHPGKMSRWKWGKSKQARKQADRGKALRDQAKLVPDHMDPAGQA